MNRISQDVAERIWRILVEECGNRDDLRDKHSFMHYLATENSNHEWRFQGLLGFGGKFHNNCGRWWISCYPEDRTDKRDEMIRKANEEVKVLQEKYT
jgi:hypothetical protein